MREAILAAARPYYDEPFRRYHDWRHPMEMFAEADRLGLPLSLDQVLALAFHDVMNLVDPEHLAGNFNEGVSAHLMRAHSRCLGVPESVAEEACSFILATDHVPRQSVSIPCAQVLDLDLMRLASPYDAFVAHSHDVHFEWRHLMPDVSEFMAARAGYLHDRFLPRDRIYHTDLFDEGAARANIERFMRDFGRR